MSDNQQASLGLPDERPTNVEEYRFEPIKGYPMLNWRGKRPFTSTRYYPAQLKEVHGPELDGWRNKIYWGDNLQVMSHLIKEYRGKIKLIYIDPPFDSRAEYKRRILIRGSNIANDKNSFEEKQYTDIWTNDEYLQFMYERLVLLRELLADNGSIYVHSDWRMNSYLRLIMDEIFGGENFQNEVIWCYRGMAVSTSHYVRRHDNIYFYTKSTEYPFNWEKIAEPLTDSTEEKYRYIDEEGRKFRLHGRNINGSPIQNHTDTDIKWLKTNPELCRIDYLDEKKGSKPRDWFTMDYINVMSSERLDYPTQKPEALLERIIKVSSDENDIVFDCFMGSGTTQAVAMKLGRRFIGADINLGAVQTTTKRLLGLIKDISSRNKQPEIFSRPDKTFIDDQFTGFEVYNVNHYDVFRNPLEARELLLEALEINKLPQGSLYDGEKDGRMVKLMPVNRIATRADLSQLITGFDYKNFEKRQLARPNEPVEKITLVCMGHEPDLKASLEQEAAPYKIDVEVVDILRERQDLQFKRDSEAQVVIENGQLVIKNFYPMNLLGKLSLQKEKVDNWRELVESVMIDWNFDGAILQPATVDIPEKNELVKGRYPVPKDAGTIRVKITDLLSESLELEVPHA